MAEFSEQSPIINFQNEKHMTSGFLELTFSKVPRLHLIS